MTAPPSGVKVTLINQSDWDDVSRDKRKNEVKIPGIIGAYIYPYLHYKVEGLVEDALYRFYIHFERLSDRPHEYMENKGWREDQKAPVAEPDEPQLREHKEGQQTGKFWMENHVSFHDLILRLPNQPSSDYSIQVQSSHLYKPVLSIQKNGGAKEPVMHDHTEFYIVDSRYKNQGVSNWMKLYKERHPQKSQEATLAHYRKSQETSTSNPTKGHKRGHGRSQEGSDAKKPAPHTFQNTSTTQNMDSPSSFYAGCGSQGTSNPQNPVAIYSGGPWMYQDSNIPPPPFSNPQRPWNDQSWLPGHHPGYEYRQDVSYGRAPVHDRSQGGSMAHHLYPHNYQSTSMPPPQLGSSGGAYPGIDYALEGPIVPTYPPGGFQGHPNTQNPAPNNSGEPGMAQNVDSQEPSSSNIHQPSSND